jgi:hypothetical protein
MSMTFSLCSATTVAVKVPQVHNQQENLSYCLGPTTVNEFWPAQQFSVMLLYPSNLTPVQEKCSYLYFNRYVFR